ncbi:MAG: hypothetical protein EPO24_14155 [Bacteroidetes bacterium]|nr:MAG: hypothetical protein EPO24_14155 [Bacteroidota bacterium]
MKKVICYTLLLFGTLPSLYSFSLEPDTSEGAITTHVTDPSSNKLFFMPTGHITGEGDVSITSVNVLFLDVAYTPINFLQFDVACVLPIFDLVENKEHDKFYSLGMKVQLIKDFSIVQGIAIGGDVVLTGSKEQKMTPNGPLSDYQGNFDDLFSIHYLRTHPFVGSFNVVASFGASSFQIHGNAAHILYSTEYPYDRYSWYDFEYLRSNYSPPPEPLITYFQIGIEYEFLMNTKGIGYKFIAETFFNNTKNASNFMTTGFRLYGRSASLDIALLSDELKLIDSEPIIPYFAIKYKF